MYQFDTLAIQHARALTSGDHHLRHDPIERLFIYLPLEHSQDLNTQNTAVELITKLVTQLPCNARPPYERALFYAHKHRDIIARFGRFPHRNTVLNRICTQEEETFLKLPGSRL